MDSEKKAVVDAGLEEPKRARKMVSFPTVPYEESLTIANAIWKFSAGEKIRRLTLFDNLEKSPTSGPSRALITASSKYKLTTGSYAAEFLELTPLGARATNPENDATDKLQASFELAILGNEYFQKLYEHYKDNRLPVTSVMIDFLVETGLEREHCEQCIEIFIINCKYLGFIDTVAGAERVLLLDHVKERHGLCVGQNVQVPPVPIIQGGDLKVAIDNTDWEKTCFFIAPIGSDGSEERQHSDLFLGQIVEPALSSFNLHVIRADQINSAGIITSQIIEHIIKSKLVVADLSFHNPNVFYELSLRHTQKKPTVHLIRKCDNIPFDINSFRTVVIDDSSIYTLLPQLEVYRTQISSQVRNLLDKPDEIENPISAYLNK